MDPSQVAVATITWARSPDEERLLRRSLRLLAAAGLPVVVADAGGSPAFTAFLGQLPAFCVTVPGPDGLVSQVQASIEGAARLGRPYLLYVEPDKERFFESALRDFIARAPDGGGAGVVLASRTDASFSTFPPMQRYAEGVINHLCGQLVERTGDYSYGPFLMSRTLAPHVASLEPRLGWGWRHSTFRAAHRAGLQVHHVAGDYECPPEQRVEDEAERAHRLRQLAQNLLGLLD
jgi:hypothetical protein